MAQSLARLSMYDRFIRWRSNWRRVRRIWFPSPAEVNFIEVMGGLALSLPFIRAWTNGYPLTILWLGRTLRRELVQREVRIGSKFADFCVVTPFYRKILEIDGERFHDIVKDQERDDYLRER